MIDSLPYTPLSFKPGYTPTEEETEWLAMVNEILGEHLQETSQAMGSFGTGHPAMEPLAKGIALEEKLWDRARKKPPTRFSGFTQTVVAETHYMMDGSVREIDVNMLDKFARIIDPATFMESLAHAINEIERETAYKKARQIMALVNESEAASPAYKQWAATGFPK